MRAADISRNPLDDPAYLRCESRRLHRVIRVLADADIKKALATHAFCLAQQAEAIERAAEAPFDVAVTAEADQPPPAANANDGRGRTVNHLRAEAEQTLDGARSLRRLADWYRTFAERTGNPTIWEARLQMAVDLEAQADGIENRLGLPN